MEGFFSRDVEQVAREKVKDISRSDSPLPTISEIALVIPAEVLRQSGKQTKRMGLTRSGSSSQSPSPDAPTSPGANDEDSRASGGKFFNPNKPKGE